MSSSVCGVTACGRAASGRAWCLLALAISGEIAGALALRFSAGFSRLAPTLFALASFALALFLVSRVMRSLPVSIAYPVWAGGGTAGVALLGVVALGEPITVSKLLGVVLVMAGVVLVNLVSEKRSGC
jgi:small multidrug resistance pump